MSAKYCCDEFEIAVRRYAPEDPAIYEWHGQWCIRADEFVIKHCPFCGVVLRAPPTVTGLPEIFPELPLYTPRDVAQILCDNSPRCDDGGCTHTSGEK